MYTTCKSYAYLKNCGAIDNKQSLKPPPVHSIIKSVNTVDYDFSVLLIYVDCK